MFAAKFGYVIERTVIVAVCLWGNWAIYYWVAVLLFDASYTDLKAHLPLLLLFWGSDLRHAPSGLLVNNQWGKSLVLIVAAPLLFSAVAACAQMKTLRTWLLLFLAVCTVAIWSSTTLFVVPLAVAMGCLVFLPFTKNNLSTMLAIGLSLAPILLLILHGLIILRSAPVGAGGRNIKASNTN